MNCPKCGQPLPEGARFCGACGNKLAESVMMDAGDAEIFSAPSSEANAVAQEGEDLSAGSAQVSPDPDVSQTQARQPAAGKSGKNHVLPVLLIAGIVIIIIAVNVIPAMMPTDEERWQEQYDLGQQYLLELDYEQAIVAFTAAIEIDENNAEAYVARAEAYLGGDVESASEENLQLSLSDYDTAISLDDANADVYESRGDVHRAIGTEENLAAALADYDSALALDDTRVELYLMEAEIYILLDDYVSAAQAYTGAIEAGIQTAETYLGRADVYYALGMEDIGEDEAEAEIEDLTDEERSYLTAALEDYEAVLKLGGASEDIYMHAAVICVVMGDYDHAAEILEEGLVSNPDSTDLKTLEKELNTLISEKEKEEIAASQRQEIEDKYWDLLMTLVAMLEEDIENVGTTDWFGDEFRTFLSELVQEQFWEMENGWYLGVYPGYPSGYVYYGEMMNGERSGYGLWYTCYSLEGQNVEATSYETNYVYEGEWSEDYPNGWGTMLQSFKYADSYTNLDYQYDIYQIEFVNGRAEGAGTMTWHQVFASGDYRREECEIQATDGELEKIHTSPYSGETFAAIFSVVMYPSLSVTVSGACIAGN